MSNTHPVSTEAVLAELRYLATTFEREATRARNEYGDEVVHSVFTLAADIVVERIEELEGGNE